MNLEINIQKKLGDFNLRIGYQGNASRIGILGASGCGKSMTLKSIAGIETPDTGRICIDGKTLFDSDQKCNLKPQKRNIGYLFQSYALFPTMTVAKNIAAGLKCNKEEQKKIVQEMIRKFHLTGLENRLPGELSGGQQQRVALARIMAYEPDAILLDEPFSALDSFLKDQLQQELLGMLEDYKGIVIMVSHSRDEIYRFSEELIIMDQGTVIESGATKKVFQYPKKKESARLTGCKNFSRCRRIDDHNALLTDWGVALQTEQRIPEGISHMGFRAHDFVPVWGDREANCLPVHISSIGKLPFETNYYIKLEQENIPDICWFVQREKETVIRERGIPDYLKMPEQNMMFLED